MISFRNTEPLARALRSSVRVPGAEAPFDTAHLEVLYPARLSGSAAERSFGIVAPDRGAGAPWPVVLFLNGIDVPTAGYRWLGRALVARGAVFVTFEWVASPTPGHVALTPGLDLTKVSPDRYGSAPTSPVIGVVLEELRRLNAEGRLAGLLDVDRVILGGHSAGGAVALHNARPAFFESVRGAFSYAAHAAAATALGYPPATFLPLDDALPLLLMSGGADGVIGQSAGRYGLDAWAEDPVETTFGRSARARAPRYFARLEGANHFLAVHPHDGTSGRAFLEAPAEDAEALRARLVSLVTDFVAAHGAGDARARRRLSDRLRASTDSRLSGRVAGPRGAHQERAGGERC